ncbi:hypothetical protein L3Q82_024383 [Scortum barcoo]|uniref:Uncharacterized protein n=1 Tax=Scortum barcoo TaxID=214431 RepID=A0ACB8WP29_9TELE|nr:hypothetical protein L3Q82_024383 [Scortum barcoo]
MASVDEFMSSVGGVIGALFALDVGDKRLKESMRQIIKENLVEVGVLPSEPHAGRSEVEASEAAAFSEAVKSVSVKAAVLKSYELVPEAYRTPGICQGAEQFKNSVPSHIVTHINEHKVKTAAEAATLADEYVLTHHGARDDRPRSSCKEMEPEVNDNPEQSDFAAFVSDGHVSLVGSEVKGEVVMGMRPALPVQGVDVILGNDLAVTRTLYQAKEEPEVEQSVKVSTVSVPVSLSSVSHSDLVAEQRADPTLAPRMDQPFMLQVDANDLGAGAVLLQADRNGVEHPEFFLQEV